MGFESFTFSDLFEITFLNSIFFFYLNTLYTFSHEINVLKFNNGFIFFSYVKQQEKK